MAAQLGEMGLELLVDVEQVLINFVLTGVRLGVFILLRSYGAVGPKLSWLLWGLTTSTSVVKQEKKEESNCFTVFLILCNIIIFVSLLRNICYVKPHHSYPAGCNAVSCFSLTHSCDCDWDRRPLLWVLATQESCFAPCYAGELLRSNSFCSVGLLRSLLRRMLSRRGSKAR